MFVIWGAMHGIAIVIHRIWSELGLKMNRVLAWIITFNFINITWVFFRARDFHEASIVLYGMFGLSSIGSPTSLITFGGKFIDSLSVVLMLLITLLILFRNNSMQLRDRFEPTQKLALYSGILLALSIVSFNRVSVFLYFNF